MIKTNVLERFELLQKLGQGVSGQVYLARHRVLGALRAVKVISKNHPEAKTFLKEAQILQHLNHPGIPRIFDVAEDEHSFYLIEEYIPGLSLQTMVSSVPKKFSLEDMIGYGMELCDILYYLHEQKPYPLLYLDLKPEHVILSDGKIRLLDFGSVREERNLTAGAGIPGTPGFLAPEIRQGKAPKRSADVYGVGALLYYLWTGRLYEEEKGLLSEFSGPPALEAVLRSCLQTEEEKRYPGMLSLKKELSRLIFMGKEKGRNPSLKVVVLGVMERVGVTHFAIGLTSWLNRHGQSALYRDESGSHIVDILAEDKEAKELCGVIQIRNFRGMPQYGSGICFEDLDFQVQVTDGGVWDIKQEPKVREQLEASQIVFLLMGGRAWELQRAVWALEHWPLPEKPIILMEFGLAKSAEAFLKAQKIRRFYQVPFFQNIWEPEKEAAAFFKKLWKW